MPQQESKNKPGGTGSGLKTFASLGTPAYRIYYAAMVGHWVSWSMNQMVRSLLVYRISGSAGAIGAVSLASAIPTIAVSLLGGAFADKIPKRNILLGCRIASTLLVFTEAMALYSGILSVDKPDSWWLMVIVGVIEGCIMGFLNPTNTAIIPELVGQDRVMNGISLSMTGMNIFKLIGPALAGFLIDGYGFSAVYFLMTAMYMCAATGTYFLPRGGTKSTQRSNPFKDAAIGVKYLSRETAILLIVIFGICHTIAGQPFNQLVPVFTESILKVSATKMGWMTSVGGVGALLGSLVLASLPNKRRGLMLLLSGIIMGVPVIVFSFSREYWLSFALMPIIALGPVMHGTLSATLVQSYVNPEYRARMQSFVTMAHGLANFGVFFTSILADAIGPQWAVGGMAMFLTAASLSFILFIPKLRQLQ